MGRVAKATEPFATSCIVLFHTARALQAAGISAVCPGAQYSFWYNALQVLPVEKGRKWLEMFGELCGTPPLKTRRDQVKQKVGFLDFSTPQPSFSGIHDGERELVLLELVYSFIYKSDPL